MYFLILFSQSSKVKGGSKQKWDDVKLLRKDLVKREQQLTASILTTADVVLSTLTSASKEGPLKFVKDGHFDLLIIDEAAQALEVSCWIPLLKVNRYVSFQCLLRRKLCDENPDF